VDNFEIHVTARNKYFKALKPEVGAVAEGEETPNCTQAISIIKQAQTTINLHKVERISFIVNGP